MTGDLIQTSTGLAMPKKKVLNGAGLALQADRMEEQFPKTIIMKKSVEDHKGATNDFLGKSKDLR